MRNAAMLSLIMVICFTGSAFGAGRGSVKEQELSQFAKEVGAKIVYRNGAPVSVSAHECLLHIEFNSLNAAFDLPLQGTATAETEAEDGIVLNNSAMTRTLSGRSPETFQNLILRFHRTDVKPMMKSFERVIAACGGPQPQVAAVR